MIGTTVHSSYLHILQRRDLNWTCGLRLVCRDLSVLIAAAPVAFILIFITTAVTVENDGMLLSNPDGEDPLPNIDPRLMLFLTVV
jgi:hypothetical protein